MGDLAALPGNRLELLKGRGRSTLKSWITIEDIMARTAIHPGEHLAGQLAALGLGAAELGRRLEVPTNLAQAKAGTKIRRLPKLEWDKECNYKAERSRRIP